MKTQLDYQAGRGFFVRLPKESVKEAGWKLGQELAVLADSIAGAVCLHVPESERPRFSKSGGL